MESDSGMKNRDSGFKSKREHIVNSIRKEDWNNILHKKRQMYLQSCGSEVSKVRYPHR